MKRVLFALLVAVTAGFTPRQASAAEVPAMVSAPTSGAVVVPAALVPAVPALAVRDSCWGALAAFGAAALAETAALAALAFAVANGIPGDELLVYQLAAIAATAAASAAGYAYGECLGGENPV